MNSSSTDSDLDTDPEQLAVPGETNQLIEPDSRQGIALITTQMAEQSRKNIHIFSRDLDPSIYDQIEFIRACKNLALRSRFSSIQILIVDSRQIMGRDHRLVALARALSSRIEIRRTEKQFESLSQTFMTVDERGYIYRKNHERYEGIANFNDPRETRELDKLFIDIWQRSHVDPEMRSLNI